MIFTYIHFVLRTTPETRFSTSFTCGTKIGTFLIYLFKPENHSPRNIGENMERYIRNVSP